MRIGRRVYLGGAASLVSMVVTVVLCDGTRRPEFARSPGRTHDGSTVSTVPARATAPAAVPGRPAATASVAASPARGSLAWEISIPTELPDSPALRQRLSKNGTSPDWREHYTYQLGLMDFYNRCMHGRIERGIVYYYLTWQIDEDHLGSSPEFEFVNDPAEGTISDVDKEAFATCVKEYIATHDSVYFSDSHAPRMTWGMGAIFPVSDSPLLKMIAEAATSHDSEGEGSPTAPPRDPRH